MLISNWSLFAQDTWNITHNLTVTYGLRREYNAAPSSPNGTPPFTVNQVDNLATATLAPAGTPLWHPQKDDFPPRLVSKLPEGLDWIFEIKLDAYRAIGVKANGRVNLFSRRRKSFDHHYPLVEALSELPEGTVVDGEVVADQVHGLVTRGQKFQ